MCNHIWKDFGTVRACVRCGLTMRKMDGKVLGFDRELPNYLREKGKAKK